MVQSAGPSSSFDGHGSAYPVSTAARQSSLNRQPSKLLTQTSGNAQRQADAYLSELLSYSLDRLRKEPEVLKQEKEQIERNVQSTAVMQYPAFIEAANCLNTINNELTSVCEHLDTLLQGTPELASACETFSADSAQVLEQYNNNKQLANGQSNLLELLEVPQLMDTCVRNAIYDEALDLQSFVSRLGLLHPDVPVVRILMQQVSDVGKTMLQQLLGRLKTNLQLPECLRIMGYLRRIAAFSEAELRLQFLTCRDEWISGLIDDLDDSESFDYVKHLTDVHRLHLFDAVMQYRAIFFDTPQTPVQDASSSSGAAGLRETSMLYSWVQHRLTQYLEQLRHHLPNITEGGNLASVVEHCMYCGSSLSRVGLDFQGLLQSLFEACSVQLFAAHLSTAIDVFHTRLESHKWVAMPTPMLGRSRLEKQVSEVSRADPAGASDEGPAHITAGSNGEEDSGPPYVVMEHFPLAVFTNAVLSALNELRHCALLSMCKPLAGLLQQTLEHAAASLMHYRHTHVLGDSEQPLFKGAARAMLEVVVPYLTTAFARIFPVTSIKLDTSGTTTILRQLLADL